MYKAFGVSVSRLKMMDFQNRRPSYFEVYNFASPKILMIMHQAVDYNTVQELSLSNIL